MPALPQTMSWSRLAIGLSLAVNLFLLAFFAAQAWHPFAAESPPGLSAESEPLKSGFFRRLAKTLPPDDARLLGKAVLLRLPEYAAAEREVFQAMERLRTDAAERPYNTEKVKADLDALQAARQKMPPITSQLLQEVLPQMSDEGRLALSRFRLFSRR
jgi:hypothetical protein